MIEQKEQQKREAILRKVNGLLAKATGTTNTHEAAAFANKAQQLMQQYNIEQYEVGQKKPDIVMKQFPLSSNRKWYQGLLTCIARSNFCEVVVQTRRMGRDRTYIFFVFGTEENIAFVWKIYEFLRDFLLSVSPVEYERYYKATYHPLSKMSWNANFFRGACAMIAYRLEQQQKAKTEEEKRVDEKVSSITGYIEQPDQNKVRALIVVQDKAVQEKIQETFSDVKKGKWFVKKGNSDGYDQGVRIGRDASLSPASHRIGKE